MWAVSLRGTDIWLTAGRRDQAVRLLSLPQCSSAIYSVPGLFSRTSSTLSYPHMHGGIACYLRQLESISCHLEFVSTIPPAIPTVVVLVVVVVVVALVELPVGTSCGCASLAG